MVEILLSVGLIFIAIAVACLSHETRRHFEMLNFRKDKALEDYHYLNNRINNLHEEVIKLRKIYEG